MPRHAPSSIADRFENHKQDYRAAKQSRFRPKRDGIPHLGAGPDFHYRDETKYIRIIEEVRAMERDDIVTSPLLDRATQNEIQGGFSPDPQTGDDGVDTELFNRWVAWTEDADACDVAGELTFHGMEHLVSRSVKRDGDIFAFHLMEGSIELTEAHRCRSPSNARALASRNIVLGVELDANRRRRRYWFTRDELDPYRQNAIKLGDLASRAARDADGNRFVSHVYHPRRVAQTRGMTAFAPMFDFVGMHGDIQFAKFVQQQVISCFAFVETGAEWSTPKAGKFGEESTEESLLRSNLDRTLSAIAPGMHLKLPNGHDLNMLSPNIPNAEWFPQVKMILQLIGINLGVPLVILLMDASETNFSGWRGAFDQAKLGFECNQRALAARFHRPTWMWRARIAAEEDKELAAYLAANPVAYFKHGWNFPKWPYIEPLKDAQADLLQVRNALNSPRRIQAARGRDWEKVAAEIVIDNGLAIELAIGEAKRLNGLLPDGEKVHWREIISLPTPDGVQIALQSDEEKTTEPQGPQKEPPSRG